VAFTSLRPCIAFVACSGAAVWANIAGASDLGKVVGAWESESICQLANSPCHDEHVIYEIAEDIGAAGEIKIEGYKIAKSSGWARCCATTEARTRTHLRTKRGQAQ
jgi:hypothetical protein